MEQSTPLQSPSLPRRERILVHKVPAAEKACSASTDNRFIVYNLQNAPPDPTRHLHGHFSFYRRLYWFANVVSSALGAKMQTRSPRVLRTAQTRILGLAKCPGFPGPWVFQNPGFNPYTAPYKVGLDEWLLNKVWLSGRRPACVLYAWWVLFSG